MLRKYSEYELKIISSKIEESHGGKLDWIKVHKEDIWKLQIATAKTA